MIIKAMAEEAKFATMTTGTDGQRAWIGDYWPVDPVTQEKGSVCKSGNYFYQWQSLAPGSAEVNAWVCIGRVEDFPPEGPGTVPQAEPIAPGAIAKAMPPKPPQAMQAETGSAPEVVDDLRAQCSEASAQLQARLQAQMTAKATAKAKAKMEEKAIAEFEYKVHMEARGRAIEAAKAQVQVAEAQLQMVTVKGKYWPDYTMAEKQAYSEANAKVKQAEDLLNAHLAISNDGVALPGAQQAKAELEALEAQIRLQVQEAQEAQAKFQAQQAQAQLEAQQAQAKLEAQLQAQQAQAQALANAQAQLLAQAQAQAQAHAQASWHGQVTTDLLGLGHSGIDQGSGAQGSNAPYSMPVPQGSPVASAPWYQA